MTHKKENQMTKKLEIYKCVICGNITEVIHDGKGELVCCGEPMKLFTENSTDAATEKHVPIIEKTSTGIKVSVGSAPHPMEEKHYIEWIEVSDGPYLYTKFLKPGEKPEADFNIEFRNDLTAREYCNIHGLWKKI